MANHGVCSVIATRVFCVDITMKRRAEPASAEVDEDDERRKKEFNKVLNFLRKSVPSKPGQIKKEKINYVTGSKLIDTLMSSQWGESSNENSSPHFSSRVRAAQYCRRLLDEGYLVGGKKIKSDKKPDEDEDADSRKKVRRFRIDWQPSLKDIKDSAEEIYIWQYEVPQRYTFIIGLIVLVGVIGFTLQPIWPESSKMGMWFLSMIMMVLLGVLLALYIVRWFLWALVYSVSVGKVVFWLLPNLDDDKLGVIDSFKPLYSIKFKKKKKKPVKQEESESDTDEKKKPSEKKNSNDKKS